MLYVLFIVVSMYLFKLIFKKVKNIFLKDIMEFIWNYVKFIIVGVVIVIDRFLILFDECMVNFFLLCIYIYVGYLKLLV